MRFASFPLLALPLLAPLVAAAPAAPNDGAASVRTSYATAPESQSSPPSSAGDSDSGRTTPKAAPSQKPDVCMYEPDEDRHATAYGFELGASFTDAQIDGFKKALPSACEVQKWRHKPIGERRWAVAFRAAFSCGPQMVTSAWKPLYAPIADVRCRDTSPREPSASGGQARGSALKVLQEPGDRVKPESVLGGGGGDKSKAGAQGAAAKEPAAKESGSQKPAA